jgi:hypothetical protein
VLGKIRSFRKTAPIQQLTMMRKAWYEKCLKKECTGIFKSQKNQTIRKGGQSGRSFEIEGKVQKIYPSS